MGSTSWCSLLVFAWLPGWLAGNQTLNSSWPLGLLANYVRLSAGSDYLLAGRRRENKTNIGVKCDLFHHSGQLECRRRRRRRGSRRGSRPVGSV